MGPGKLRQTSRPPFRRDDSNPPHSKDGDISIAEIKKR